MDVEVQPDGRIIAGGSAEIDFAVARYNGDGTLDSSFSGPENPWKQATLRLLERVVAPLLATDLKSLGAF